MTETADQKARRYAEQRRRRRAELEAFELKQMNRAARSVKQIQHNQQEIAHEN